MKTEAILILTAALIPALIAITVRPTNRYPPDLRDAPAALPALEQFGHSGVEISAAPAPHAVKPPGREAEFFASKDIMAVIASTRGGRELLKHFESFYEAEFPKIVYNDRLTTAERKAARRAGDSEEENKIGLFIKSRDFRSNRPHIILYKSGWPLQAIACVVAHELQHAADLNAPWYRRLNSLHERGRIKLARAKASGGMSLEDLDLEDLDYGLGYVKTFFSEYLAYSRGAAMFTELVGTDPEANNLLSNLRKLENREKSILEMDPLNDFQDRRTFMETYFYAGNRNRFKAGVAAVLNNQALLAELKADGLDSAIAELAAFYAAPAPVYRKINSLKDLAPEPPH